MDEKVKKMPKVVDQSQAQIDLANDFQLQWALNLIQGKAIPESSLPAVVKKAN